MKNKLILGNCLKELPKITDETIDLIVTDPPFAINFKATKANYNRKESNVLQGYEDVKPEDYNQFTYDWLVQSWWKLKKYGSMYVISGYNNLNIIENNLKELGFYIQNNIIWKFQFGVRTKRKFVTSHYHILFVTKHKTKYDFYPNCRFDDDERCENGGSARYQDMEDVWRIQREYWTGEKKTPTKLPAELIRKILSYSSKKGDLILDPFIGSGQVAYVAKNMERNYIGIELVKEYYDFAMERLKCTNKK